MRVAILAFIAVLSFGCATKTTKLVTAQVSHDSLALAQDIEAQLCWGVANAKATVPDRTRCTTDVAIKIALTDARHQAFNQKLAQAFILHEQITSVLRLGGTADTSQFVALLESIVTDLSHLETGFWPDVTRLINTVKSAEKIR